MSIKKIAVLPGDGIGPEVTREAMRVLEIIGGQFGVEFDTKTYPFGGASIDKHGIPLTEEVTKACLAADAVFLGAIGGPKWDNLPKEKRAETGLLGLRSALGLYTNLRPIKIYDSLKKASALKPEIIEGVDILIVRELTGGVYFGTPKETRQENGEQVALDTMIYSESEIERIAHAAFKAALKRSKKVHSVDKANVLESSRLWRSVVIKVAKKYPDVHLEHILVDNCAMQLVRNPASFDVMLTSNLFGDILSDEAAMISGSIGLLPSASLGETSALYEPVHGSAPDIAGYNKANPLAAIASLALMFRHTFNMNEAALSIENTISNVLNKGYRSGDIAREDERVIGTREFGDLIIENLKSKKTASINM